MKESASQLDFRQEEILPWLICPQAKAQKGCELPLQYLNGALASDGWLYPIVDGVPNLRLPFDQASFTSYDDILDDFATKGSDKEHMLEVLGLSEGNITDCRVLLTGVGGGVDIEWILSCNPKKLVCMDYSTHVIKHKHRYPDPRLAFVIGDACDIPFRRGTFDTVLSMGVIQQTRSPELAFDENVRVLRAGGNLAIANLYSKNLHNQRISMLRHKYRIHEMPRDRAKRFLAVNVRIYTMLCKTGLWRLHRRFMFPGVLQYANLGDRGYDFYYANAEDYYMAHYRHLTSVEEVRFWTRRLGAVVSETTKGYKITKVEC
jgi:SAM-dependent methyltransferase